MENPLKWRAACTPSEKRLKKLMRTKRGRELDRIFQSQEIQDTIKKTIQKYQGNYIKSNSFQDTYNEACIGACEAICAWILARDKGVNVCQVTTWASRGVRFRLGQVRQPQLVHTTRGRRSRVHSNNISYMNEKGVQHNQDIVGTYYEEEADETLDTLDVVAMLAYYDKTASGVVKAKLENPELTFEDIGKDTSIFTKGKVTKQHTNKIYINAMVWISKVLSYPRRNRRSYC